MTRNGLRLIALVLACVVFAAACTWRGADPTTTSPTIDGEFEVASMVVTDPVGFGGGTIWYPTDDTQTYGGVAVVPGYISPEATIAWYGPRLASHGFVVITLETNTRTDGPNSRGDQMLAALDHLTAHDEVGGLVDPDRLAVMGWSMGGGGSLHAVNTRPSLKAAVPLAPWHFTKAWDEVTVPTMVIACEDDAIAVNDVHSEVFYESIPAATPKAYLEVADGPHNCVITESETVSLGTIAWLKRYVDDDTRYDQFLCPPPAVEGAISEYRDTCPA